MHNKSVRCCLLVNRDKLRCTSAAIPWVSDMNRTLFEGKEVCWCLAQIIPRILQETDANNQVMLYGSSNYSQFIDSQKCDFGLFKMIKRTNLDIKDAACLHIVHIMQHPTSCPTTKSTQTTLVNTPKNHVSPLPAGKHSKLTKRSTQWRHQTNDGKSGWEAERARALGASCSFRSKKQLAAVKRWETHISSNEEKEKWIEDYLERETTVARKRVEDTEAAVQ